MRAWKLVLTALVVVAGLLVPSAATAERRAAPALDRPTMRSSVVVFKGRTTPRSIVRLQVRGAAWQTVKKTRAARSGSYRIVAARPAQASTYRVVANGRPSRSRTVRPPSTPPSTPGAPSTPPSTPPPATDPGTDPGTEPPVTEEAPKPAPSDACGTRPKKADGTYWACSFVDEFSGTTLDTSKWLVQQTAFSGMTSGNNGCYVDNSDTVSVGGGQVRLTSRKNLAPFTCASPYGSFTSTATSSTLGSYSRFTQTYGRFAVRAKMPAEAGIPGSHTAFWLYPQEHTYGEWPKSGEIDVAEWFSALPGNVYPSVHYAGEDTARSSGYNCPMPTSSTAFHTYAVEWTPTIMRFYYDDKLCYSHSWTPTNLTSPAPFDKPFYLVLTQAWGLGWNEVSPGMPDTSTFVVDWVRAWK